MQVLQSESQAMKTQCFEVQLLLKKMTVEISSLKEALNISERDKASILDRFNSYGEQL